MNFEILEKKKKKKEKKMFNEALKLLLFDVTVKVMFKVSLVLL